MSVPPLSFAAKLTLIKSFEVNRTADNPRVQVSPSPNNTVTLVGMTIDNEWVAEYRCLAEDFDERCIRAMERRVRAKERTRPRLV